MVFVVVDMGDVLEHVFFSFRRSYIPFARVCLLSKGLFDPPSIRIPTSTKPSPTTSHCALPFSLSLHTLASSLPTHPILPPFPLPITLSLSLSLTIFFVPYMPVLKVLRTAFLQTNMLVCYRLCLLVAE